MTFEREARTLAMGARRMWSQELHDDEARLRRDEEATTVVLLLVDTVEKLLEKVQYVDTYHPDGACRSCGVKQRSHSMDCRHYVGPLKHEWASSRWSYAFGTNVLFCLCGGTAVESGQAVSETVCPRAEQSWRGPRGTAQV